MSRRWGGSPERTLVESVESGLGDLGVLQREIWNLCDHLNQATNAEVGDGSMVESQPIQVLETRKTIQTGIRNLRTIEFQVLQRLPAGYVYQARIINRG